MKPHISWNFGDRVKPERTCERLPAMNSWSLKANPPPPPPFVLASSHMTWDHSPPPPPCEVVQQRWFLPEAVPTRLAIQHSSLLEANAVQSGLGSPSAEASLNQPVHQVTAQKRTFKMGPAVLMGGSRTTLVRSSRVMSLVRLQLGNLLLWGVTVGNVCLVFIVRLKPGPGWKPTPTGGLIRIGRSVKLAQIVRLVV
ncbi:hypothetical protein VZT92_001277 [Zoarces viviparus]